MKLFDAMGYAHAECGKIIGIRNGSKKWISYELLDNGAESPPLTDEDFLTDDWEIGWERIDEDTGALYIGWDDEY